MVKNSTEHDNAKRLWLSSMTGQPLLACEKAQHCYERLVLYDMDDEEAQVDGAKRNLAQGHTLTHVWHTLKGVIPPARYVKTLRPVVQGQRDELDFIKIPTNGTTLTEIKKIVQE